MREIFQSLFIVRSRDEETSRHSNANYDDDEFVGRLEKRVRKLASRGTGASS